MYEEEEWVPLKFKDKVWKRIILVITFPIWICLMTIIMSLLMILALFYYPLRGLYRWIKVDRYCSDCGGWKVTEYSITSHLNPSKEIGLMCINNICSRYHIVDKW